MNDSKLSMERRSAHCLEAGKALKVHLKFLNLALPLFLATALSTASYAAQAKMRMSTDDSKASTDCNPDNGNQGAIVTETSPSPLPSALPLTKGITLSGSFVYGDNRKTGSLSYQWGGSAPVQFYSASLVKDQCDNPVAAPAPTLNDAVLKQGSYGSGSFSLTLTGSFSGFSGGTISSNFSLCGNGTCDSLYGENQGNCSADCTTPGTPLSVTISTSTGPFSITAPPALTVRTQDDALSNSTYTIVYTNTGKGNCGSGTLATKINTLVDATGVFTYVYDATQDTSFFNEVALCGPGIYTLNTVTSDFAGRAQIVTGTYTLVDLTPTNLVSTTTSNKTIAYAWTP